MHKITDYKAQSLSGIFLQGVNIDFCPLDKDTVKSAEKNNVQ